MTVKLTDDTFNETVLTAEAPLVLVDFWADWCGPCKVVGPILEEISEGQDDILVAKVDVDENQAVAKAYGIRSIPTMLLFKEGELVAEHVGAASKIKLLEWIDENK